MELIEKNGVMVTINPINPINPIKIRLKSDY